MEVTELPVLPEVAELFEQPVEAAATTAAQISAKYLYVFIISRAFLCHVIVIAASLRLSVYIHSITGMCVDFVTSGNAIHELNGKSNKKSTEKIPLIVHIM